MAVRMIDPWVNVTMGGPQPEWMIRVKEDYFRAGDEFLSDITEEKLLADMDEAGVEKAILSIGAKDPDARTLRFAANHPKRFAYAVSVDPRKLLRELWRLEELAKTLPVAMARVVPFLIDLPPTHPVYYPLYAKCVELDVAFQTQVGHTGPLLPSETGRPIYIDQVALDFPELRIICGHIGWPWTEEMIAVAWKHANVFIDTSAHVPKHYPQEFVHFMKTFGKHKVCFATDYPLLPFTRVVQELAALDLSPEVRQLFLRDNARRALKLG